MSHRRSGVPSLLLVSRERKNREPLADFRKLGIGGHQPRSLLDGQLGGKGIRVSQTMLLFEGAAVSGSRPDPRR